MYERLEGLGRGLMACRALSVSQPEEEKRFFAELRCVYDWKVAFPTVKRAAQEGRPGGWDRLAELNRLYPSVERPFARPHPVTKKIALMGDPTYVSHIVGMSPEETRGVFRRVIQLCEVPEYQLRVPWYSEGDVAIFDNYVVKHRIVADFYKIPLESRALENIGTKGYPTPGGNKLVFGVDIDDSHNPHHTQLSEEHKLSRARWSSTQYFAPGEARDTKKAKL